MPSFLNPFTSSMSHVRPLPVLESTSFDFITFDFETANRSPGSICQIGIAAVKDEQVVEVYTELVDPEEEFDWGNIKVHGIQPEDVVGAHAYPVVAQHFSPLFQNNVAISHSVFDRTAFTRASDKYGVENPLADWADSTRIVRRTWPELYGRRGYGLGNLAKDMGFAFSHHDAGEDARVTALIVLRALEESGSTVREWLNGAQPAKKTR